MRPVGDCLIVVGDWLVREREIRPGFSGSYSLVLSGREDKVIFYVTEPDAAEADRKRSIAI